jgi:hypothetical protein
LSRDAYKGSGVERPVLALSSEGKYDASRTLSEVDGSRRAGEPVQIPAGPMKLLPAA